jgi:hypothetical protein
MPRKQSLLVVLALAALGFGNGFQFLSPIHIRKNVGPNVIIFSAGELSSDLPCVGDEYSSGIERREFIKQAVLSASTGIVLSLPPRPSFADTTIETQQSQSAAYFSPPGEKFSYTVTPPPSFTASNKPLKTHLDEINFSSPDVRGYTLGVTVDPVRIKSIREFGTPEEVAARVVTAEVNRDGVFEVTLAKDPLEDANGGYDIEYISEGKRGVKRFVTRIYIKDGFLYVLTAQSKNDEYDKAREKEITDSVKSFRPL